ncbi:MAG: RNA polymerase sigma factor [Dehalococcoidia bacterium]
MNGVGARIQSLGEIREAGKQEASPRGRSRMAGDAHALSEEGLVRRAQQYDPDALAQIYETFYSKLYAYAYMQLGNASAAEDVASAVLLQVLESLHRYRFRGVPLSAWVFRIARNRLIDMHRRRRRRPQMELLDGAAAEAPAPEDVVERSLEHDRLRQALRELGDDQRQVILLKFMQGLDNVATAQVMGRSQAAVKSLQHRALLALRRILSGSEAAHG